MAFSTTHQTRLATKNDTGWIVDLSSRVQTDLTSRGSAQVIGPLALQSVESSLQHGHCFIFETLHDAPVRNGSVLIDQYSNNYAFSREEMKNMPEKKWVLHALMIEPEF
jgi:hypothetical protein